MATASRILARRMAIWAVREQIAARSGNALGSRQRLFFGIRPRTTRSSPGMKAQIEDISIAVADASASPGNRDAVAAPRHRRLNRPLMPASC